MRSGKKRGWLLLVPMVLVLGLVTLVPSIDAVIASLFSHLGSRSHFVGLDQYRHIMADRAFSYSLNITIGWASLNVLCTTFFGITLAERMQRRKKARRGGFLYGILLIPWGIPIYIAVPLWRALLHGDGGSSLFFHLTGIQMNLITDPAAAYAAALMVSVWMNLPLTTFVIYSHLRSIDPALLDSARLESADRFMVMHYIQYPLVRSSVMIMATLNFVKACKEFTLIYLLTGGGVPLISGITERYVIGSTTTLGVLLYDIFTGLEGYGIAAAYAVMMGMMVVIVMGFWLISRTEDQEQRGGKMRRYASLVTLVTIIFSWNLPMGWKIVGVIGCISAYGSKRIFTLLAWGYVAGVTIMVIKQGFLAGFSPAAAALLFVLVQQRVALRSYHRQIGSIGYRIVSLSAVLFMVVSSLLIVYYLFWLSLSGVHACYVNTIVPPRASLDSFIRLFTEESIIRYMMNTALIAVGTALLVLFVVVPAAWMLANHSRKVSDKVVYGVHVTGVMGGMHSLIPLFMVFVVLGLVNTYIGLIFVYTAHAIPFALMTVKNFFEDHDRALKEAALLDGASTMEYLRFILMPLSLPMIKTTMLVALLGAWNGFMAPLILLFDESRYPISLKLYSYVGSIASGAPRWGLFAAAAVVNLIIIRLIGGRELDRFSLK